MRVNGVCKPTFENKDYGRGAGIPARLAAWALAFAYICGLIGYAGSANQNAKFSEDAPFL